MNKGNANKCNGDDTVDFFIIGAPKSGTTSLAHYLSEHPDVCFSKIKEPFYFNKKSPSFNGIVTESEYMELFDHCGSENHLKGEGSTWYLYSEDAVDNILNYNPNAKFIVCVRNPVDAVASWHGHMRLVGAENIDDLESAWDAQAERKKTGYKPPVYKDVNMLLYRKAFYTGHQIERLLKKIDKKSLHIVFFDDIVADTGKEYKSILEFLELKADERSEFPVKYPRVNTRSGILRFIGSRISYRNRIKLTKLLLKFNIDLYSTYFKLNTSVSQSYRMDIRLRKKILKEFIDDIELLSSITGRDLNAWLTT